MLKVSKEFTFDSAHKLENIYKDDAWNLKTYGKCNHIHGHTYKLVVTVAGDPNPDTGMLVNFVTLKEVVTKNIIRTMDHKFLNTVFPHGTITTCENMLKYFWNMLVIDLPNLYEINLWETPTSYASMQRDI